MGGTAPLLPIIKLLLHKLLAALLQLDIQLSSLRVCLMCGHLLPS